MAAAWLCGRVEAVRDLIAILACCIFLHGSLIIISALEESLRARDSGLQGRLSADDVMVALCARGIRNWQSACGVSTSGVSRRVGIAHAGMNPDARRCMGFCLIVNAVAIPGQDRAAQVALEAVTRAWVCGLHLEEGTPQVNGVLP